MLCRLGSDFSIWYAVSLMSRKSDTAPLARLAAALHIDQASAEFRYVWALMTMEEEWTPDEVQRQFRGAVAHARNRLDLTRQWGFVPTSKPPHARARRRPLGSSWLHHAAALTQRMAELARADAQVQAFRRDVLGDRLLRSDEVDQWVKVQKPHTPALTRLDDLAKKLAGWFWWEESHARRFLLTDTTPPRAALRARTQLHIAAVGAPRVVLEVEMWVPPDQVRRVYGELQDRLQAPARRHALTRALTPRAVTLVGFIESTPGSWGQRLARWNKDYLAWKFDDRRNFQRTYDAAKRRLDLSPEYLGA